VKNTDCGLCRRTKINCLVSDSENKLVNQYSEMVT